MALNLLHYLLISIGINLLMFIPAFKFKTDKLTDLSYSLTFIILIAIALFNSSFDSSKILLTLIIVIWALRLGIFLFVRINRMKKDTRFDEMRTSFFAFLRFWLLQGLAVWVILIPALLFMSVEKPVLSIGGIIIWLIGLIIESIADYQKFKFKFNIKNKGKFISTGIWRYSRHPNYFGEILCWIGVYIAVFGSLDFTNQLISLVSPLFIIVLLLFVSGIPLLEKQAEKRWGKLKEYKEYKRKTSVLIPWFRK